MMYERKGKVKHKKITMKNKEKKTEKIYKTLTKNIEANAVIKQNRWDSGPSPSRRKSSSQSKPNMSVLRAIAVFLCGFLSLRLCGAQIVFPGTCPHVEAMKNFEAKRYLGRWYEAEKYFAIFELGGRCIMADYGEKDDVITVTNKQINNFTGAVNEIKGYATIDSSESDEAKLLVYFPKMPVNIGAPYWVIDTDYDSYAVVWGCYEFGTLFHARNAWILTRERNPPDSVLNKAYEAIKRNDINQSYFIKTDQNNCKLLNGQK